jgi:methylaspartate mutase sigma subunit
LVFLELLLTELGVDVLNLGPCVPDELLVARCRQWRPELMVFSTVNGHGYEDGVRAIRAVRATPELAATPAVIGGKLGTGGDRDDARSLHLLDAGFNHVFDDQQGMAAFTGLVLAITAEAQR